VNGRSFGIADLGLFAFDDRHADKPVIELSYIAAAASLRGLGLFFATL